VNGVRCVHDGDGTQAEPYAGLTTVEEALSRPRLHYCDDCPAIRLRDQGAPRAVCDLDKEFSK
jgi:hypothetical protein